MNEAHPRALFTNTTSGFRTATCERERVLHNMAGWLHGVCGLHLDRVRVIIGANHWCANQMLRSGRMHTCTGAQVRTGTMGVTLKVIEA